jgi:hypothetical protein
MTLKSILECERHSLERMRRYQLSNVFKKIGAALAVLSFILLFVNAYSWDSETVRHITRYGMLIGLLLVVVSKEQFEDERITQLRAQAFTYAFVFGVIMAIAQPFIEYFVDRVIDSNPEDLKGLGDFQILWTLLVVQIAYFELLKRVTR